MLRISRKYYMHLIIKRFSTHAANIFFLFKRFKKPFGTVAMGSIIIRQCTIIPYDRANTVGVVKLFCESNPTQEMRTEMVVVRGVACSSSEMEVFLLPTNAHIFIGSD